MIGIEWTSNAFRAFRITGSGTIRDRRASPRGVAGVQDRRFGDALREEIGPWLAAGEHHVLMAGPLDAAEGWGPARLLPCPAGAQEIAAALATIPFDWAEVHLLPRLTATDPSGVPEATQGDEARFVGALASLAEAGHACLPGARSRWVRIEQRRIAGFSTHLTLIVHAALRGVQRGGRESLATDLAAFAAGLAGAGQPGGLLHHLAAVASFRDEDSRLLGILIGHEVRAALATIPERPVVHVIGQPEMTSLYRMAIEEAGGIAECLDGDAIARGLWLVGVSAGLA